MTRSLWARTSISTRKRKSKKQILYTRQIQRMAFAILYFNIFPSTPTTNIHKDTCQIQQLCNLYTVYHLCRKLQHIRQNICRRIGNSSRSAQLSRKKGGLSRFLKIMRGRSLLYKPRFLLETHDRNPNITTITVE